MRSRRMWVLALGLLLVACDGAEPTDAGVDAGLPDAAPAPDAGGPPDDLEGFVDWWMGYGAIPGAAYAIVTPDSIVTGAHGLADVDTGRPVDEHTLFVMASISKTFAVASAMQLVEAGQLDLDAPVDDYLGYPLRHPGYPDTPITSRMLFNHVSGLEDAILVLGEVTYEGDPPMTLDEFTRAYAVEGGDLYQEGRWASEPGTAHAYCNAAYGILGAVLEGAAGESLRDYSRMGLFEPLALDEPGWFLADVDLDRLATPHSSNGRTYRTLPHNGFAYYPASSLKISITGLARFAQMVLRGGELDGTRVLSEASVEEMLRIQDPAIDDGQALGFYLQNFGGHTFIGHGGSTLGGSNQMLLAVEGTHAVILITNSDAHIRSRVPTLRQGREAIGEILVRLDQEIR